MTKVIDTSVLYAAFHPEDINHKRAHQDLAAAASWRVPLAVLAEFLGLVGFRHGQPAARQALADLRSGPLEVVQPQEPSAVERAWAKSAGLSFADAVGIQEALQSGAALLTYDAFQEKAYRMLVP